MLVVDQAPLSRHELDCLDAYWRAANYLSVGQIYLTDNPLLREPLRPEHIKARLLGHWGTGPGLNLLYAHLFRVTGARGQDMIFVSGPGHGGPAPVANAWLEGTYCLRSRNYVNVIVAGKQPATSWPGAEAAERLYDRALGSWDWASNDDGEPDVVLVAAGDVPAVEVLATADLLRQHLPDLKMRVVNVVDLPEIRHRSWPHGRG